MKGLRSHPSGVHCEIVHAQHARPQGEQHFRYQIWVNVTHAGKTQQVFVQRPPLSDTFDAKVLTAE